MDNKVTTLRALERSERRAVSLVLGTINEIRQRRQHAEQAVTDHKANLQRAEANLAEIDAELAELRGDLDLLKGPAKKAARQ